MLSQTIFLFICLARFSVAEFKLEMLHVVFRHGDKVPHKEFQNYPNDPYKNHSYYPYEDGDLTNLGKMREYKIGLMLREKYNLFFGPDYRPSLIYGQSTSLKRTKMSLQLVIAGLFPPSEKLTWNPDLPWTPVDLVYVPWQEDYLLFPDYCPRYKEEHARILQLPEVKDTVRKYKNVMGYLTYHTGKPITTTSNVNYLYNLLKEEANQNLSLPLWTKKVFPDPMTEITKYDFSLKSYTTEMRRFNGGALLRQMTDEMKLVRENKMPEGRKASFFAGHESNVAALSKTLRITEGDLPAYGSAIILETLVDDSNTYYVRVRFWTGVTEQLLMQNIPGCDELCPLDDFLLLMKDVIPNDKEFYCYGKRPYGVAMVDTSASTVPNAQALSILSVFAVLLTVSKLLLQ